MKKHLITGLVLMVFALVCGALLALVNYITEPRIKSMEEKKIQESISIVCPLYNQETNDMVEFNRKGADNAYYILDGENVIAIIYVISNYGYASNIKMMIALDSNAKVIGYTVISQNETKGDTTKHDFNMIDKTDLSEFDSLAGSTFSSEAIKDSFKQAFNYAKEDLNKEVNSND